MALSKIDLEDVGRLRAEILSNRDKSFAEISAFIGRAEAMVAQFETKLAQLVREKERAYQALCQCELHKNDDEENPKSCDAEESAYQRAAARYNHCLSLISKARGAISDFKSRAARNRETITQLVSRSERTIESINETLHCYLTNNTIAALGAESISHGGNGTYAGGGGQGHGGPSGDGQGVDGQGGPGGDGQGHGGSGGDGQGHGGSGGDGQGQGGPGTDGQGQGAPVGDGQGHGGDGQGFDDGDGDIGKQDADSNNGNGEPGLFGSGNGSGDTPLDSSSHDFTIANEGASGGTVAAGVGVAGLAAGLAVGAAGLYANKDKKEDEEVGYKSMLEGENSELSDALYRQMLEDEYGQKPKEEYVPLSEEGTKPILGEKTLSEKLDELPAIPEEIDSEMISEGAEWVIDGNAIETSDRGGCIVYEGKKSDEIRSVDQKADELFRAKYGVSIQEMNFCEKDKQEKYVAAYNDMRQKLQEEVDRGNLRNNVVDINEEIVIDGEVYVVSPIDNGCGPASGGALHWLAQRGSSIDAGFSKPVREFINNPTYGNGVNAMAGTGIVASSVLHGNAVLGPLGAVAGFVGSSYPLEMLPTTQANRELNENQICRIHDWRYFYEADKNNLSKRLEIDKGLGDAGGLMESAVNRCGESAYLAAYKERMDSNDIQQKLKELGRSYVLPEGYYFQKKDK